jgi:mannosyltransferase OCH1-like enzyme
MKTQKMLKIPKIIHQVYDYRKGGKIPKQLLKISSTWKMNHPGWEYIFWDHYKIDAFLNE